MNTVQDTNETNIIQMISHSKIHRTNGSKKFVFLSQQQQQKQQRLYRFASLYRFKVLSLHWLEFVLLVNYIWMNSLMELSSSIIIFVNAIDNDNDFDSTVQSTATTTTSTSTSRFIRRAGGSGQTNPNNFPSPVDFARNTIHYNGFAKFENNNNNINSHIPSKDTNDDEYHVKHNSNNLTAVIHIGPMKTGSTAVQRTLLRLESFLKEDDYEIGHYHRTEEFLYCFMPDKIDLGCQHKVLDEISEIATVRGHNLILSQEDLYDPYVNLEELRNYFQNSWQGSVRILAGYRRYFDWYVSFHNQAQKYIPSSKRVSIVQYVTNEYNRAKNNPNFDPFYRYYVVGSIERYRKVFDNVIVYNIHSIPQNDICEAVLCDGIPDASHTCQQYREEQQQQQQQQNGRDLSNRIQSSQFNTRHPLIYDDLAQFALDMGLWTLGSPKNKTTVEWLTPHWGAVSNDDLKNDDRMNGNELTLEYVRKMAQHYQEDILGYDEFHFRYNNNNITNPETPTDPYYNSTNDNNEFLTCVTDDVYQWLLETSYRAEQMIVTPEYFEQIGKHDIEQEFTNMKLQYCHVNATTILLQLKEWRTFFQSL